MSHFSLTDLSNRSAEAVAAAWRGPVHVTCSSKRNFVLVTVRNTIGS